MGTYRVSEGAVSHLSFNSCGAESRLGRIPGEETLGGKRCILLRILQMGRSFFVLVALFLLVALATDFRAEAQFGTGRSKKSIFSRNRSSSSSGSSSGSSSSSGGNRQSSSSTQSESESAEAEEPPAPPAQAQPAMPVAPVPGKVPGKPGVKKGPAGKGPAGKGSKAEEKTQAGIPPEGHVTLFVVPMDQMLDVGKEFPLHVWLDNPQAKPIEVVSFVLAYDPRRLEYIDAPGGPEGNVNVYDQSEKITKALPLVRNAGIDPFYMNRVDQANGMIYYRARCPVGETTTAQGFLVTMKFRALTPTDQTGLRFVFSEWPENMNPPVQSDQEWSWPKEMTFVGGRKVQGKSSSGEWVNLLGSESSPQDGVVSGNLTLKGDYTKALQDEAEELPKGEAFTRIVLAPRTNLVQVGKTFDLQVKITNPKGVPWDRVRFDIQYDPNYLEVVDTDSGNWITRGTNILDGPFHNRFPFEWTRSNMVRQAEGRILYEAGIFTSPLRADGTLATIHFQALRPVPETWVAFHMPSDMGSREGTILTRKRLDILADTENVEDGVSGALVSVVPRKPGSSKEEHAQSQPNLK